MTSAAFRRDCFGVWPLRGCRDLKKRVDMDRIMRPMFVGNGCSVVLDYDAWRSISQTAATEAL